MTRVLFLLLLRKYQNTQQAVGGSGVRGGRQVIQLKPSRLNVVLNAPIVSQVLHMSVRQS